MHSSKRARAAGVVNKMAEVGSVMVAETTEIGEKDGMMIKSTVSKIDVAVAIIEAVVVVVETTEAATTPDQSFDPMAFQLLEQGARLLTERRRRDRVMMKEETLFLTIRREPGPKALPTFLLRMRSERHWEAPKRRGWMARRKMV